MSLPCCFFAAADWVAMIALYFDNPGVRKQPATFSHMDDYEPTLYVSEDLACGSSKWINSQL